VYALNPNRRVLSADGTPAATTESRDLPDGTTEVQSAINAAGTDWDWSGRVQTQVAECVSNSATGSISVGCAVSPGYVMVGGGAQDVWDQPGAMLWESHPLDVDNSGAGAIWVASSKDHLSPATHTLHVWVVGLKLKRTDGTFLTHDELKAYISYSRVTSAPGHNPSASCSVAGENKAIIGGGVRSNWQATGGVGQLLTTSLPDTSWTWLGASKDHITADEATVDTYCIGIDASVGWLAPVIVERQAVGGSGALGGVGGASSFVTGSPRSVATCYGGQTGWAGAGRMLFRMAPGDGSPFPIIGLRSFSAAGKDHIQADQGFTNAWVVQIRLLQL